MLNSCISVIGYKQLQNIKDKWNYYAVHHDGKGLCRTG